MSFAKITGTLVLAGGAATATGFLLTSGLGGMPEWRPAADDKSASTSYTGDKYAVTYKKYLVGVDDEATSNDKKPANNKSWWDWVFRNRYEPKKLETKGKFSGLQKAIGNTESLQAICKEAYAAKNTGSDAKIKATLGETGDTDKFKESDIWLFCSPAKEKIKSVSEENNGSEYTHNNAYGNNESDIKKDLVSTTSESKGNKWFWDQKEKETEEGEKKDLFKKGETSIKDWCSKAYKNTQSSDDSSTTYTKQNVFKYCSLSGVAPQN